jgi:hypothetical protein
MPVRGQCRGSRVSAQEAICLGQIRRILALGQAMGERLTSCRPAVARGLCVLGFRVPPAVARGLCVLGFRVPPAVARGLYVLGSLGPPARPV